MIWLWNTSSTAQGGGGSFKNRKPIGELGCCESRMAGRIHWWTESCMRSPLFLSLSLTIYLCIYLSICLSFYLSIDLSIYLSLYLSIPLSLYLSIFLSIDLSICLSIYLSINPSTYLFIYPSIYLSFYLSIYLSFFPSIYLSLPLSLYLSIYRSIYLSVYLSIYLFIYLFIYLSVCLSVCLSICKLENEAILGDFLQKRSTSRTSNIKNAAVQRDFINCCTWQRQKRSNSARLPHFFSWQHQKRSNSARRPSKMESWADGLVPMHFAMFRLHLSKLLCLPQKSDAMSY